MPKFKFFLFLIVSLLVSELLCRFAYADFKLLDSIEEFGERRYADLPPARLKAGPVIFHPTLRSEIQYDSNILHEDEDEHEDVLFNIMPGAILDIPIDKHQLIVGYEADLEHFVKRTDQNDQNQNFIALADINFPTWYVNVLERFAETSGRSGTTFTSRIPRYDQSIHPKIGYRWKRMTFEAFFRHFMRDFRRQVDDPFNFQVVEWGGVMYFDLFARLKALVDYSVAQIDYDDNFTRNGTFQQARVGLTGELMPNLVVDARVGPHFRDYEENSEAEFHSWVAYLNLEYQMRENLEFHFTFSREPVEATFAEVNFYREHYWELGGEYEFMPRWFIYDNAKYYRHNYAERETLQAMTGFRRDHHVGNEVGLRYFPRDWVELRLSYEYLFRQSNFPGLDYNDHIITLSSSLTY